MSLQPDTNVISLRLMDKVYEVACPPPQREAFNQCVELFQSKAQQVQGSDPHLAADRLAVLTALNLGHDLLALQAAHPDGLGPRLQALSTQLEATLDAARKQNLL